MRARAEAARPMCRDCPGAMQGHWTAVALWLEEAVKVSGPGRETPTRIMANGAATMAASSRITAPARPAMHSRASLVQSPASASYGKLHRSYNVFQPGMRLAGNAFLPVGAVGFRLKLAQARSATPTPGRALGPPACSQSHHRGVLQSRPQATGRRTPGAGQCPPLLAQGHEDQGGAECVPDRHKSGLQSASKRMAGGT